MSERLSKAQWKTLQELEDGARPTAALAHGAFISATCANALIKRGLARRLVTGAVGITDAGRTLLKEGP